MVRCSILIRLSMVSEYWWFFSFLCAHAFLNTAELISAFIHVDNWAGLYSADA